MNLIIILLAAAALLVPAILSARGHGWLTVSNAQADAGQLARYALGSKFYFAETGTTVGIVVMASDAQPDVSSNYDDVPFMGCVESVTPREEVQEDTYHCAKTTGGWERRTERNVVADYLDIQCSKMSEPIHRLLHGKSAAIAAGTPFQPDVVSDRSMLGWALFQNYSVAKAGRLFTAEYWVELRITTPPGASPNVQMPTVSIQILANALNSVDFDA